MMVDASNAFMTTVSAVLTRADLTWIGVHVGWRPRRTAAEPATCGDDIDVPLKNSQSPSLPHGLPVSHTVELRTLTPTEARSGLIAKSTNVGPWLLKLA